MKEISKGAVVIVLTTFIVTAVIVYGVHHPNLGMAQKNAPVTITHRTLEPGVLSAITPDTAFIVRRAPEFDPVLEQWKMLVSRKGEEQFFAVYSARKPTFEIGAQVLLDNYRYWVTDNEKDETFVAYPAPTTK